MTWIDKHRLAFACTSRSKADACAGLQAWQQDVARHRRGTWGVGEAAGVSHGYIRLEKQPEGSEGECDHKREYERCAKQERRVLPAPSA